MNPMLENILEPIDHRRVWYRQYDPLPYPQSEPPNWSYIQQQVDKAFELAAYTGEANWQTINLSHMMSRREAHFWLTYILTPALQKDEIIYDSSRHDGNLTFIDFKNMVSQSSYTNLPSWSVIPLHILFDIKDYLPILLDLPYAPYIGQRWANVWLPYLTSNELEIARQLVKGRLQALSIPIHIPSQANRYASMPSIVTWAFNCGLSQHIYPLVNQFDDDHFADRFGRMKLLKGNRYADLILSLQSQDTVVEEMKRVKLALCEPYQVRWWLAHTGTTELEYVRDSIAIEKGKVRAKRLMTILGGIKTAEVAGYMFELMNQNISTAYAQSWLKDHPEEAVEALVKFTHGHSKQANTARNLLRTMIRDGHEEIVIHHADTALMDKLIDRRVAVSAPLFDKKTTPDWLHNGIQLIDKAVKAPRWITPTMLPPLIADGHQLNDKQVKGVLRALKATKIDYQPPLVGDLQTHIDRHILDNFLWRLMEQWKLNGERLQEVWAFSAVIRFGTDKLLPKVAPIIKEMMGRRKSKRNIKRIALDMLTELAYQASDTAYIQLEALRPTFHAKRHTYFLDEAMQTLARQRGVSLEDLKDLAVPDCGLDENGTRLFDYGRRQFIAVIGSNLNPMVRDDKGKIRKSLPKPGKTDDPIKAEAAYESWKFLKKQLRETIKRQAPRLEQAMIFERRWSIVNFEKLFLKHPTMRHFARDIIWGTYQDKTIINNFRITQDGQFVDYADQPIKISADDEIGIVHPVHLDEATVQHWQNTFIDFEIIPLFSQMNRPVFHPTPEILTAGEVEPKDVSESQFHVLAIRTALFKAGYEEGYGYAYGRYFPNHNITVLMWVDEVDHSISRFETAHYISKIKFNDGILPKSYRQNYQYLALDDIPPIVYSEALYDLKVVLSS